MLWGVSALKCSVFQKIDFSRFLINQTYCSTDRNCDKKFGLNLPGLFATQLMLDQSNVIFDRSNLFFNWSKIGQWVFKKVFLSRVHHTVHAFFKSSLISLVRPIQSQQFFVVFLLKSLMFLSSCASTTFLPLLFHFIHIFHAFFMHFRWNFWT